jgi:NDP-sugar pyrophosphorylase family protein
MSDTFELHAANPRRGMTRARSNGARTLKDVKAVVLAGGRGTRLAPYTTILPKPLMPVGEHSILEIVVAQLEKAGVVDIRFSVGYLSHLIRAVFDSRPEGAAEITYVLEEDALGTAAPLKLMNDLDGTFIVMNGDVLTTLDFGDIVRHHRKQGNALTIATHDRSIKIDYGILTVDAAHRVGAFEEKPEIVSAVSMGIYVMEPEVLKYIPEGSHFDFPDLVGALLDADMPIGAFRYDGLWFDIGRHEDYERAVSEWIQNGHANGNGNGKRQRQRQEGAHVCKAQRQRPQTTQIEEGALNGD